MSGNDTDVLIHVMDLMLLPKKAPVLETVPPVAEEVDSEEPNQKRRHRLTDAGTVIQT
jgi:hypothetical protein